MKREDITREFVRKHFERILKCLKARSEISISKDLKTTYFQIVEEGSERVIFRLSHYEEYDEEMYRGLFLDFLFNPRKQCVDFVCFDGNRMMYEWVNRSRFRNTLKYYETIDSECELVMKMDLLGT